MKITSSSRNEMARRFLAGETMEQIAAPFDITRQRVQQILTELGIRADQGGANKGRAERRLESIRARAYIQEIRKQRRAIRRKFDAQRANAFYRGIDWDLTFSQWVKIWHDSGKLEARGRGRGKYCMCRIGDRGPYREDNVFIGLYEENCRGIVITRLIAKATAFAE